LNAYFVKLGIGVTATTFAHFWDFEQVGIQPLDHTIVVVKLGHLFQALRDIAPRTLVALTPGFGNLQLEKLPYKNLSRPIYPLDPNIQ
jgi:microcystin degradation protein MlrC